MSEIKTLHPVEISKLATGFPRLRRTRRTENLRRLVRETELSPQDFIYPLLVRHGRSIREEISSLPGVYRWSLDRLSAEVEELANWGIPALILFGIPKEKDPIGRENFDEHGIVQESIRIIKRELPEMIVITDVCLCEYTDHGHCGLVREGEILNDESLEVLGRVSLSHAAAGADLVAPSGGLDGQVAAIREALDAAGYSKVGILAYAAKYASAFYGPFREAADSAPRLGDRKSHQLDPPNVREALREVAQDIAEGADLVMVKPALAYLDVIRRVREHFHHPLAAYNVSGEYAMVKAAAQRGWIDERRIVLEILTGIKRAGADMILTYHAKEVAQWLKE